MTGRGHEVSPVVVAPGASTPATSEDYDKVRKNFDDVVESKVGRWVAALTALTVPLVTAFCAWLQKQVGINRIRLRSPPSSRPWAPAS